ncbi:MAG: FHA domain-containing protein [Chloroflexi bacterium]|nr:FHA domain-containing protein [Chloroflexota bacterium]
MKNCPYCGWSHVREGLLFCEECGQPLTTDASVTLPTRDLKSSENINGAVPTWGTTTLSKDSTIVLHIGASEPLTLPAETETILGRRDGASVRLPDLDLTPYGALEKGVSRIHASIQRKDDTLMLVDMGSSNGTHLNGQRLVAEQPRVLRDGDEIRLGKLTVFIYFKG